MDLLLIAQHEPLVGAISSHRRTAAAQSRALRCELGGATPECAESSLGSERLREVVVGTCLEAGDDVVGVGACRHHHDRHVARLAQRPAQLEPVDSWKHDVDQDHIGRLPAEPPRARPRPLAVSSTTHPRPRAPSSRQCGCARRPRTVRIAVPTPQWCRMSAVGAVRHRASIAAPAAVEEVAKRLEEADCGGQHEVGRRCSAVEVAQPRAPASAAMSAPRHSPNG